MPLPLIIGAAAAVAAAGYGIKKGLDAKDNYDRAKVTNDKAREIIDDAKEDLEYERERAQNSLEECAEVGVEVCETLKKYQAHMQKIGRKISRPSEIKDLSIGEINFKNFNIKQAEIKISDIATGGIKALGAGVGAGFAAFGGIATFGTASTGTAIATLGGAAATNATLAWLGGGSLATGGMGIAAGTAVLGGIVAAPVLLVGGLFMSNRCEAELEKAKTNYKKAEILVEEIEMASSKTRAITELIDLKTYVLEELNKLFNKNMPIIQAIQPKKQGFLSRIFTKLFSQPPFSKNDQKILDRADMLYIIMASIVINGEGKMALLTEDGCANPEAEEALVEVQKKLLEDDNAN